MNDQDKKKLEDLVKQLPEFQLLAKALWGDMPTELITFTLFSASSESTFKIEDSGLISIWKYHLQQMVIANDPIKYLGENI